MHTPLSPTLFGIEPSPELLALQEARARAVDARIAAERALRDAEAAEAQLLREEEQAIAAAIVERRRVLHETVERSARDERQARDRIGVLERELEAARGAVEGCRAERERAEEALHHADTAPIAPIGEGTANVASVPTVSDDMIVFPSAAAQRAAERRAADAARAARR